MDRFQQQSWRVIHWLPLSILGEIEYDLYLLIIIECLHNPRPRNNRISEHRQKASSETVFSMDCQRSEKSTSSTSFQPSFAGTLRITRHLFHPFPLAALLALQPVPNHVRKVSPLWQIRMTHDVTTVTKTTMNTRSLPVAIMSAISKIITRGFLPSADLSAAKI